MGKKILLSIATSSLAMLLGASGLQAEDFHYDKPEDCGKSCGPMMPGKCPEMKQGMMGQHQQMRRGMKGEGHERGGIFRMLQGLSKEEREELKELRKKDPEAFKKAIKEKIAQYQKMKQQEHRQLREMLEKYRTAGEDEKAKYLEQIKAYTKKQFEEKMQRNREHVEQAEARLADLKQKLAEREKKADSIVDERVRELTRDPSLKW